jgi:hypothetical protein
MLVVILLDALWSWLLPCRKRLAVGFPGRLLYCVLVFTVLQHLRCPVQALCVFAFTCQPADSLTRVPLGLRTSPKASRHEGG